ncbi:GNAT family N-acetyltransferase [Algibacter luteus]|uniref:Acetyltransferase (GNAT) domain-containing protein n=1 Tax=Algibacter luteus TaxID=1178825 RepID=A0A1M6BM56_9FLAO|nr:Acetyltransferase (GNAT) domain-containing protein [Algibacter luteus]
MTINIIHFEPQYSKKFYELNREWLETFFVVEPYDEEVLSKPQKYIIDKGGHIFFAKLDDAIVGTVALMPMNNSKEFELTKMAVSPNYRGKKIGQQMMQYCIDFAKDKNIPKLIINSSRKLKMLSISTKNMVLLKFLLKPIAHILDVILKWKI